MAYLTAKIGRWSAEATGGTTHPTSMAASASPGRGQEEETEWKRMEGRGSGRS
jgi:hypothetical protein